MTYASTRLPMAQFAPGARSIIRVLQDALLRDDDLMADLDAVLGATAGPTGVAGAKRQPKRRREQGRLGNPLREMAELGRSVTRLDRILSRLVDIAREREWQPPYPNVAEAIAYAESVRAVHESPVGEFPADRAQLRRLAMAASDLVDLLADDDVEVSDDAAA
ncbi:hypothetical protein ACN6LM_001751 [Streptomyces sp. SAS_281]|uniref:hypothetical protein n=1 Tax=Streptomyces sp. SAS_281 TaxID=3412744 RepID=UPI00403C2540